MRRKRMRVAFTARHYKPSKRLKEYAEDEITKLEKVFDGIISCDIVLDYQKDIQIAEINVVVHGQKLTVIEKTDDVYKSIDLAVGKMERQLIRYKEKKQQYADKALSN